MSDPKVKTKSDKDTPLKIFLLVLNSILVITNTQVVLEWLVHSKSGDNIELVTEEILEDMVDK